MQFAYFGICLSYGFFIVFSRSLKICLEGLDIEENMVQVLVQGLWKSIHQVLHAYLNSRWLSRDQGFSGC